MIIGLTGGIASGKSLATKFFRECGIPVIDTDDIARQVVAPGQPAWFRLREAFAPEYFLPDGQLDRTAMARLVFTDEHARRTLESITHPAIYTEVERQVAALDAQPNPPALIVVAVPLLFETDAASRFDATVLVVASREQQIARLMKTRGYSRAQAEARISAQMSLEEKQSRADFLLDNRATPGKLREQIRRLIAVLCHR